MMSNYKAVCIPETQIPLPEIAANQFERSGGKLKKFGNFGTDPLQGCQHLQALRQQEFKAHNPPYSIIFNAVANNDPKPLIQSIMCFITSDRYDTEVINSARIFSLFFVFSILCRAARVVEEPAEETTTSGK